MICSDSPSAERWVFRLLQGRQLFDWRHRDRKRANNGKARRVFSSIEASGAGHIPDCLKSAGTKQPGHSSFVKRSSKQCRILGCPMTGATVIGEALNCGTERPVSKPH